MAVVHWLCVATLWTLLSVMSAVEAARTSQRKGATKLVPAFHGIWECPDVKTYYVLHNCTVLNDEFGSSSLYANFTMTKPIKRFSKMTIILHRHAEGAPWEYFGTWSWTTALCELMVAKGMFWSGIVRSIVPPVKCPVKEGNYYFTNGTIDLAAIDGVISAGEKYSWRMQNLVYDDLGGTSLCTIAEAHLNRVLIRGRA